MSGRLMGGLAVLKNGLKSNGLTGFFISRLLLLLHGTARVSSRVIAVYVVGEAHGRILAVVCQYLLERFSGGLTLLL